MKNLHLIVSCSVLLYCTTAFSQITSPVIKANFGVEADLSANHFNNLTADGGDDWFSATAGTGVQVIDTTGAAAILAAYYSDPATRTRSFSRLMYQLPFTVVNNHVLLDAVFNRDFHGDDSTVFASGSNKNGMSPADWSCPVSQNIPAKNEILDVFAHVRRAGPMMTDSLWMFGGISIENTTGNRYFDFELSQTDLYYDFNTRQFVDYGPDSGHTAWKFDAAGNILAPGDIIFSAEFSSSSITNLEARIWVHRSDLNLNPAAFNWGGAFDGATNSSMFGYASILPKTSGNFYSGLLSNNTHWAGPFALVRKDNSIVTDYLPKQFMEFSVNLSKLGLDPAAYSINICNSPFRRVLVKTRSSTSFSSELKDFVAPMRMFNPPPVDAHANITYFCGNMPDAPIQVYNPNNSSVYTWTSPDGNIVSSDTGSSILVNSPGTYYVTQQFHSQCAPSSIDSVTILYDSSCLLLDVTILDFRAARNDKINQLFWEVDNNQMVSDFIIEYSMDNRNYFRAGALPSMAQNGRISYRFTHTPDRNNQTMYYRLRINKREGGYRYSRIIPLVATNETGTAVIYPNPSKGHAWLSLRSSVIQPMEIVVFDNRGRQISARKIIVRGGDNTIQLTEATGLSNGMYFVKISYPGKSITLPLIRQ